MALSSLARRVLRFIDRETLIPPGARVAVACSGGGDSVALAALLCELAQGAGWSFAGLLHVNHGLRGAAADGDEAFCRDVAATLGVPIAIERVDVAARARAERVSIEAAGHRVRYELFARAVREGRGDLVATGHTRDDQAETVLLRLIRGAGPAGLAGIRPRIGAVVRPLLDVRRDELREYLGWRGLPHREDPSNHDERILRNRVRHRLIPFLADHFSPAVTDVLARDASIARDDADWLDGAANAAAREIVQYKEGPLDAGGGFAEGRFEVDAARLAAAHPALARRVALQVLERAGGRRVGFDHVERLRRLAGAEGTAPVAADFPGCRVERRRTMLGFTRRRGRQAPVAGAEGYEYPLAAPGEVEVSEAGFRITAEHGDRPARLVARGGVVALPAARITLPLTVRSWRPGDVFRPLGLGGRRKKMQDFFVDRKVPRDRRATVPLVVDDRLGIVWVAGYGLGEGARMIGSDEGVIILKIVKTGGSV
ncbi:MAG: tRNA lysidine(34) synthetase TilS [Acidobacteriota bacterium]|nr:tRNA lysidine(34) synthetase TilS [Acidobacteriota bacterium]